MSIGPDSGNGWWGLEILVVTPTPTHPQDYGNRKRIFEICSELKKQGANIHLVHYASEHDWRTQRPKSAERDMNAAWASYQLIAPSRPLHEAARGLDHEIDEWADPALSGYIRWICSVRKFDAVIVNYTWMSFCFDSVPKGVFRILDTNDVFSNRRAMLQRQDIAPEFFYTTEAEEAKAVARADLVWAIKHSEKIILDRLGAKACITLLHAEPERGWWTSPPSRDGWLRVGVIGARNNVNRRNLEMFLEAAIPVFESYASPVKVIIAGGCSDDFNGHRHPNVEVMGRVADIAEFYRGVDVAATPMQFGTGLKIKVSEAFASGAPLISHVHATEGYPTDFPLHILPSFEAMAFEITRLAFDPSGLPEIAAASHEACRNIRLHFLDALEDSLQMLRRSIGRNVLVVAQLAALNRNSLLFDHLHATLDFWRSVGTPTLYLTGPREKFDPLALRSREIHPRILVEPALADDLGDDLPESWTRCALGDAIEMRHTELAYFLCGMPKSSTKVLRSLRHAYVRYDAVIASGSDPVNLVDQLRTTVSVSIISAAVGRIAAVAARPGVDGVCQAPYQQAGAFVSFERKHDLARRQSDQMLIIGSAQNVAASALVELAKRLAVRAIVLDPADMATCRQFAEPFDRKTSRAIDVLGMQLIVDLTDGDGFAAVITEGAELGGIPVVRPAHGAAAIAWRNMGAGRRPETLATLLREVARGLKDSEYRVMLASASALEVDIRARSNAGWAWLLQDLKTRDTSVGSAVEALFA